MTAEKLNIYEPLKNSYKLDFNFEFRPRQV